MLPLTKTEAEILNYLYKHSDKAPYAAEIARDIKLARRSVYRALDSLEKKEIVQVETRGRMKFYSLTDSWMGVVEAAKMQIAEIDETQPIINQRLLDAIERLPVIAEQFGFPLTTDEKKKLQALRNRINKEETK